MLKTESKTINLKNLLLFSLFQAREVEGMLGRTRCTKVSQMGLDFSCLAYCAYLIQSTYIIFLQYRMNKFLAVEILHNAVRRGFGTDDKE